MNDAEKIIPETAPKMDVVHQIAQTLKERRASRSLTLEKVTQNIKIRIQYLQAMESGAWSELPGEVYVRGFIRRYAQYLGLDGDKLLAPYLKLNESPAPVANGDSHPTGAPGDFSRVHWLWLVLAGVFLIGLVKVIKQERTAPIKSSIPAVKQVSTESTVKSAPAKVDEVARAPLEKHELGVFSPYPLWLRVTAAEKSFEGFIPQSDTWTWKGEGEFTVRLGHTKEVHLLFDGKEISLAEDQKKVTLPL